MHARGGERWPPDRVMTAQRAVHTPTQSGYTVVLYTTQLQPEVLKFVYAIPQKGYCSQVTVPGGQQP